MKRYAFTWLFLFLLFTSPLYLLSLLLEEPVSLDAAILAGLFYATSSVIYYRLTNKPKGAS